MKLLLGTDVIVDFPTRRGNIYPREIISSLLNRPDLRHRIKSGKINGGILDHNNPELEPKRKVITHTVTDIRLYNDEIVVEVDISDDPGAKELLAETKKPMAFIIMKLRDDQLMEDGIIVRQIEDIISVHIGDNHAQFE